MSTRLTTVVEAARPLSGSPGGGRAGTGRDPCSQRCTRTAHLILKSRIAAVGSRPAPPRPPPASRLETAKSDRGEDDPHDAHQIDLEAQAEGHGQESQINCRGRREAD